MDIFRYNFVRTVPTKKFDLPWKVSFAYILIVIFLLFYIYIEFGLTPIFYSLLLPCGLIIFHLLIFENDYVPSSICKMSGSEIGSGLDFISEHKKLNITLGGVILAEYLPSKRWETGVYVVHNGKDHWVSIDISPSKISYFDPLGNPPEGFIKDFVFSFEDRWINNVKIQVDHTVVCGAYCLYFVYLRNLNYSPDDIVNVFRVNTPSELQDNTVFKLIFQYCKIFAMAVRNKGIELLEKLLYKIHMSSQAYAIGKKENYYYLDQVEDMIID